MRALITLVEGISFRAQGMPEFKKDVPQTVTDPKVIRACQADGAFTVSILDSEPEKKRVEATTEPVATPAPKVPRPVKEEPEDKESAEESADEPKEERPASTHAKKSVRRRSS